MNKLFSLYSLIHLVAPDFAAWTAHIGLVSGKKLYPLSEKHLWVWSLDITSLLCTEWAWVRRTRQKRNHSWVCLSLWTSAGCVGIKRNQSLCKLDQWEANNISAPVPLLQTVFHRGGPQTFCRLLPVNNRKYHLLGVTAMFVALVFGSVLTIHHQKSLFVGAMDGSALATHLFVTHWITISGTPLMSCTRLI